MPKVCKMIGCMGAAYDLQTEMNRQMLLRGNRACAALIVFAALVVNCWLVPDAEIAVLSLAMAAGLLGLSQLANSRYANAAAGASLAILGLGLSAMYLRGVVHDHALDQALNGALLLPILSYACLLGYDWRWLAVMVAGVLGLEYLAFVVHGPHHAFGLAVLSYSAIYTLGMATVVFLVLLSHRRVLGYAEAEAARAQQRGLELQIAEARVRAVLDAIPNPIFAKDRDLRYVDCNAAFCAVLALPRDAILGRTVRELVPGPSGEAFHQADLSLLARGGIQTYETQLAYPDGSDRPVIFHKSLVLDGDGRPAGLVGTFIDLSDHRRLQERLLQAEKLEALGRLAGGVAHDMNNQLVGILGHAELLAQRLPPGPERTDAELIATSAIRAADLPRRLLAYARRGNYVKVPVDLHRLVDDVCSLLVHSIGPSIRLERQLAAPASTVVGDPGQLQSALLNLALNARDAMPQGGILEFRTTCVELPDPTLGACRDGLPPGRYLRLQVIDTGHGMDEAVQRRIFEPFFTTRQADAGTGLGLASVYGAVRNHGGGIGVHSQPGQGTAFSILLPLAEAGDQVAPQAPAAPSSPQRLLVIDDDAFVRKVLCAMLQRLGHEPVPCPDGPAALALAQAGDRIDGAVLDLLMPAMSGQEVFHRLRALRPGLTIVIASGHHNDQEAQALLDAGARAFLAKPVALAQLAGIFGGTTP